MCTLEVPVAVLEYIDRARMHCLWRNSDCSAKTNHLWLGKNIQSQRKKGCLRILNLRSQNSYLRIKHLDKFFNHKDLRWVRLIWNSYYRNLLPHTAMFLHGRNLGVLPFFDHLMIDTCGFDGIKSTGRTSF
jgi:hypothetical protein